MKFGMLVCNYAYLVHKNMAIIVVLFDNFRGQLSTREFSPDENTSPVTVQTESRPITEENLPLSSSVQDRCFRQHARRFLLFVRDKDYRDRGILATSIKCERLFCGKRMFLVPALY
ncbi:hypothetical protein TNCV_3529531 [Trichonephila clavipes]|uniref:Uncharacterized protein n=1 Tax=Trichonephila clavipes TaxID=2585209 RepID=A0A8X6V3F2_TRICX|nr:hypothetical protein TNCV_3529531 [Trichonephila clavipes]